MPSSDSMTIHPVLKLVHGFQPKSILDVGCGNGKYGFLFREMLDWNYGRFEKNEWEIIIDGLDICSRYLSKIHDAVYNVVFWENWLKFSFDFSPKTTNSIYDLIFMGDVLEHFKEGEWQEALQKAMDHSKVVICVCPNWDGSINQGALFGNEHERHWVILNPHKVGGKCVWANSKAFITVHSKYDVCIERDVIL